MISPKNLTENSDKPNLRGRQRGTTENSVGQRIISAVGDRPLSWLARETGLPESSLGDATKRGIAKVDMAVKVAQALGVTVDWLLTGSTSVGTAASLLVAADDAEFIRLPRFDLAQLTDDGKGARVETIPVRKDWLYRRILTTSNLWLTELPADNDPLGLQEGDVVICSDVRAEGVQDNWVCIFRAPTGLFVAKYHLMATGEAGTIGPAGLAEDVHPVARIHARLITRI
ncbi:helix-turn-helix domain containing protein [Sphingomonas panni]|uniref:helix-turn-helix domain containing protein n=1 Tax=Sphingomonas panni TaxID=237612 RepID=UPI001F5BB62F|nr:helix-turn-helix domain containing protein [Sphingomonas panni]